MAYTLTTTISLQPDQTGLTLAAQLVDTTGAAVGGPVSSGFAELGNGHYLWHYTGFPDSFRGAIKFSSGGSVLAVTAINPQEAEYTDAKTSSVAAPTVSDIRIELDANSTALANLDVPVSTRATLGTGGISFQHTTLVDAVPTPGVDVWITTTDDANGFVVASGVSDAFGHVNFRLDAGTYWAWHQKAGVNFSEPTVVTVP